MATKFNSNFDKTHTFTDTGAKMELATGVALSWTVPGDSFMRYRAEFQYTSEASVWVAINKVATVPGAGTISDAYNEEFRPDIRYVQGGDVLSFITSVGTPQVGVNLLQLPN